MRLLAADCVYVCGLATSTGVLPLVLCVTIPLGTNSPDSLCPPYLQTLATLLACVPLFSFLNTPLICDIVCRCEHELGKYKGKIGRQ